MGIQVELNGAGSSEAFLIAGGQAHQLTLRSTDGVSRPVTIEVIGAMAAHVQLSANTATVDAGGTNIDVQSTIASQTKGDITFEVSTSGTVEGTLEATSIQSPSLQFEGRFQCRLASDPDGFDSPWGQFSSFGMYAVQGSNAAEPAEPPLDRIIRFQNPVALRSLCPAVGVFVRRVGGTLADGTLVRFEAGDPLIGLPVELGPQCVFDARDGSFAQPGFEAITNFLIGITNVFSGESVPSLPRPNPSLPPPSTAPYADGVLRTDMAGTLKPPDFGYPDADWTSRANRIVTEKVAALNAQSAATPEEIAIRDRRVAEHANNASGIQFALRLLERYRGLVDRNIALDSTVSPVLADWAGRSQLPFYAEFMDFDTDCQCGTVWGTLGE